MRGGNYEWNIVNVLSADLAGDDIEREVKVSNGYYPSFRALFKAKH